MISVYYCRYLGDIYLRGNPCDNDGDFENKITGKYKPYEDSATIKICADSNNDLNTLEPQLVDANKDQLDVLRDVLDIEETKYPDENSIIEYMKDHKTDYALKIFDTSKDVKFPQYILDAISWEYEQQ